MFMTGVLCTVCGARVYLDISVGVGAFVIGLRQMSSFLSSYTIVSFSSDLLYRSFTDFSKLPFSTKCIRHCYISLQRKRDTYYIEFTHFLKLTCQQRTFFSKTTELNLRKLDRKHVLNVPCQVF